MQECYLRAFRNFDSYRGPSIEAWLLAIVRNVCYAELKRRREEPVDLVEHEPETEFYLWQAPQRDPELERMVRQKHATIRELVRCFPAHFREAIVLREFCDLSYRDIAETLSVPIGTAMSRLARARAMLFVSWTAIDGMAKDRPRMTNQQNRAEEGRC